MRRYWLAKTIDAEIFSYFQLKEFPPHFTPLRVSEQSINSSISFALAIIDAEIVAGQLIG